jgi:hypothetical protein
MSFSRKLFFVLIAMLLIRGVAVAQIPVEVFGGHKKTTLDIMFFKYFKDKSGNKSKFLFFNRNRASIDYQMTSTSFLPQFGFTEAISFNHPKLKGFAPVAVGQLVGTGVYTKAGFQFAYLKKDILIFTWLVSETKRDPTIDIFFLGRFTPKLTEKINLFSQLELINAAPTMIEKNYLFTQRIRLGLKMKAFQFGIGADFTQSGRASFSKNENLGVFLRHEL